MHRRLTFSLSLPLLGVLLGAPLMAQDSGAGKPAPAAPAAKQARAKTDDKDKPARDPNAKADSNRAAGIHRASKLLEAAVVSEDSKDVGKVEDVVFDPADGKIQFVALDAAKFTDAKDKLVGVPGDALQSLGDPERVKLVGIDKEKLAAAPSFTKSSWPKDGDREFVGKVWKHYERKPYWDAAAPAGGFTSMRLSALMHSTLVNAKGEELGKIENYAVDLKNGKLLYIVVHPAASQKAGEKAEAKGAEPGKKAATAQEARRVAVPWTALAPKGITPSKLVLDIDMARFMTAPGFESDKWPDMSDTKWAGENDAFFAAHPAAGKAGG